MSITTRLNEALKPHGFSARRLPNEDPEMCDDAVEILNADGIVTEVDVQIFSHGSGSGYGVNRWEGDGFYTLYSGRDAAAATSVVLETLGLS